MTAVLAYLRILSVAEWIGIAAASWLIVGSLVALPFGRMIRRGQALDRAQYPPPVPPYLRRQPDPDCRFCRAADDLDWLFDQPDEVWLTDPVVRDRCRQIEIAEGWAA